MLRYVIGLLMCLLLQANCEMQRTSESKKLFIPFYKLYTPQVIRSTAEFTSRYYNYSLTAITFNTGTPSYRRLFKIPLIPAGILSRYPLADITVRITVGLQNDIRSGDSDPKFMISDGKYGVGFELREEGPYHCRGIQGTMGNIMGSRIIRGGTSARVSSSVLPEEFVLTLAPSQRWGSCRSPIVNGLISPVYYTRFIYPNQGLWLEVYAEDRNERYLFNYIIVEIHEN